MKAEDVWAGIKTAQTIEDIKTLLQRYAVSKGFANFCFLHNTNHSQRDPVFITTVEKDWYETYASNNFIDIDPCLIEARRRNFGFTWSEVTLTPYVNAQQSRINELYEAAYNHGLTEGFIVPIHYVDEQQFYQSASCTLFWKADPNDFYALVERERFELHAVLSSWSLIAVDMVIKARNTPTPVTANAFTDVHLTEKQREVLAWAAMGKTASDVADILGVKTSTIQSHLKDAYARLGVNNKQEAINRATRLGLIRPAA